ncbi:site-specific DNA-methyltransferase [Anaerobiospirillum sp. NML120449]|uniref:site-specific DNA-methyltransferase n=1 Tax=Anaerobiospirillum sp. NML120449 TaxID=2932817 RepID=UPI001FF2EE5D|nr:site-specific DNA-methyltransferase [Anaerobiospirillum sp. NML120449]MCK0527364.1 site-specific DNA-methyltransferase [Anaerobiospirillum sp. NML120449]
MDKLTMQSVYGVAANIDIIARHFPSCITEAHDSDGQLVHGIDFDKLRSELSSSCIPEKAERYQFTWPGKMDAARLVNHPSTVTLRPCRDQSVDFDTTSNLYIEGDNLEVLKVLRNTYVGKVKMIYIDPPYNTGKDFVYKDNYAMDREEYLLQSGQIDAAGGRLVSNTTANGRYHTDWLNMIYPRLKISRELLKNDGVIFIAIDEHEVERLKMCCNEIFGEDNLVGTLILKTATDNNPTMITTEHEYCLCYARNKSALTSWTAPSPEVELIVNEYQRLKSSCSDIREIQDRLRAFIKKNESQLQGVTHYNVVDEDGVVSISQNSSDTRPGPYRYEIIHPVSGKPCPTPANGWRWPLKTFEEYEAQGLVYWGADHTVQPRIKKRIETVRARCRSVYIEDGRTSTRRLEDLLGGKKIFDNPKSDVFIKWLMKFVMTDSHDIVLDFFGGSSTTADALMQLNSEDGGKRSFILVQLPAQVDEKSEAARAGYNNICQIGLERIRRAGDVIRQQAGDHNGLSQVDTGFRLLRLDSSNMKDVYYGADEVSLGGFSEFNIKDDRSGEDLLFQVMLDLGIELSSSIEVRSLAGHTVYVVNDGYLAACFDDRVSVEAARAIAGLKPHWFVMCDAAFGSDADADNIMQVFAGCSEGTRIKVI